MEYIFSKKILLQEIIKRENTTLQTIEGQYLFPGGKTFLLVNKCWGSSYFPVKKLLRSAFFRGVLINGYNGSKAKY